jgi:hypothetical protein
VEHRAVSLDVVKSLSVVMEAYPHVALASFNCAVRTLCVENCPKS